MSAAVTVDQLRTWIKWKLLEQICYHNSITELFFPPLPHFCKIHFMFEKLHFKSNTQSKTWQPAMAFNHMKPLQCHVGKHICTVVKISSSQWTAPVILKAESVQDNKADPSLKKKSVCVSSSSLLKEPTRRFRPRPRVKFSSRLPSLRIFISAKPALVIVLVVIRKQGDGRGPAL